MLHPHPGPVGRGPHPVAGLGEELMRHLHPRQMPQQHPVGMQRPLGRPGGARGVADEGRVLGAGFGHLEGVTGLAQLLPEAPGAGAGPEVGAIDREHRLQPRQPVADRRDLGQVGLVGDQRLGPRIGQPVLQPLLAEQGEQRQRDGAQLVGGEMGQQRLRHLPQQHRHPVAARHPVLDQRIGEPVRVARELGEAVFAHLAIRPEIDQRQPAGLGIGPFLAHVPGHVVARRHLPAVLVAQALPIPGGGDLVHAALPMVPGPGGQAKPAPRPRQSVATRPSWQHETCNRAADPVSSVIM